MNDKFEYRIIINTLVIKNGSIIPNGIFENNRRIKRIIFKSNITKIESNAFSNCNIEELEIPSTVKEIRIGAFNKNGCLKKLKLNEGLVYINIFSFNGCDIEKLEIPSTVKIIGSFAFQNNKNLKILKLNEGLVHIKEATFNLCNIEKLEIPSTVKYIGDFAFQNNRNLKILKLNEGLEDISSFVFNKSNIEEITIPSTVEFIGVGAFKNNPLKKVYLYEGSPVSKYSKEKLIEIFGDKAEIIIIPITKTLTKEEANIRLNNVSTEESKRLGYELLNLISNDNYKEDNDNLSKVKKLLLDGADTEVVDDYINTGLMICIKKNLINTFNMYLSVRCNINHKNKLGDTPLILCARDNRNDMADVLINSNCFIKDINKLDETALSIAYKNNNWYLINELESILGINKKEEDIIEKARRLVRECKKDE